VHDSYITIEPLRLHEKILQVKATIKERRAEAWAEDVKRRQERHEKKWLRRLGLIGPLTEEAITLWYAENWAMSPKSYWYQDINRCNELLSMCKIINHEGPPSVDGLEEFVFLSASDAEMLSRW
jgi:hypothetical protein